MSLFSCGYPCSHVLRVTNELSIDMIKVQHWKLYASHYNDNCLGIGDEIKKLQFQYTHYEGMGVPINRRVLDRARKPSLDDVYPYFYYRESETTNDDYESALKIERTNCCVTTIEYANEIHLNCNSEMSANPVSDLNEFNYILN